MGKKVCEAFPGRAKSHDGKIPLKKLQEKLSHKQEEKFMRLIWYASVLEEIYAFSCKFIFSCKIFMIILMLNHFFLVVSKSWCRAAFVAYTYGVKAPEFICCNIVDYESTWWTFVFSLSPGGIGRGILLEVGPKRRGHLVMDGEIRQEQKFSMTGKLFRVTVENKFSMGIIMSRLVCSVNIFF